VNPDRTVTIPVTRLAPWIAGFHARHGRDRVDATAEVVSLIADDGARADIGVPFPPLPLPASSSESPDDILTALLDHAVARRRVGAVLVRKGGYAVGVFHGADLVTSKVGSGYVQGRTKAGGWSQQRYARRRDNQSQKAYADAAEVVARLLVPEQDTLVAVVTGGDRPALSTVLADPRLRGLVPLVQARVIPVVDPRLRVLQSLPEVFLTVTIGLNALA